METGEASVLLFVLLLTALEFGCSDTMIHYGLH